MKSISVQSMTVYTKVQRSSLYLGAHNLFHLILVYHLLDYVNMVNWLILNLRFLFSLFVHHFYYLDQMLKLSLGGIAEIKS